MGTILESDQIQHPTATISAQPDMLNYPPSAFQKKA